MFDACAKEWAVLIQNGYEVVHEINVTEFRGQYAYALRTNADDNNMAHYVVISQKKYENLLKDAEEKGYDVFDYSTFKN